MNKESYLITLATITITTISVLFVPSLVKAEESPALASHAINELGIDLLNKLDSTDKNVFISPYSIQSTLAMVYAGADGSTKAQMAKVLHFSIAADIHASFNSLNQALEQLQKDSAAQLEQTKKLGGNGAPFTLSVANRIYAQVGYTFRQPYLSLLKEKYSSSFEARDFLHSAEKVRREINSWVEEQTHTRIRDLIPPNGVSGATKMALVNAIYFKAAWQNPFAAGSTLKEHFVDLSGNSKEVATMIQTEQFGYKRQDELTIVSLPYSTPDLQLLILMPDKQSAFSKITARLLDNLNLESSEISLHLPKFKIEPPLYALADTLQELGLLEAFDKPKGSANFNQLAAPINEKYLLLSQVFHKTFIELDEDGTEAAAATAAIMIEGATMRAQEEKPIEVHIDRPFVFAIQHRASSACLFLGRVNQLK